MANIATISGNIMADSGTALSGLQPLNTNLTSLGGLSYASTSFVKMTATGTFSLDTNIYYLASNPSGFTSNVGTVTSVAALTLGTSGTDLSSTVANGTTTPVITLNIPTASATNRGALSSTDWTTFNNKQDALTNPITGTGTRTLNYLPLFSGTTNSIANSSVYEVFTPEENIGVYVANILKVQNALVVTGNITGTSIIKSGGTSSQFLKADGSVDSTAYGTFTLPSLTSGSVLFSNGTTIAQNNSNFFWDNTNGRLGLGTNTNISATLTLYNTSASNQLKIAGNAAGAVFTDALSSPVYTGVLGLATQSNQFLVGSIAGDFVMANQKNSPLLFGTGATTTEKMRMNSSGNLSIGNTNNTYKLDVTGDVRFSGKLLVANATDYQGALQVNTSGGNLLLNTDNSNFAILFRNTVSSNKLWDISSFNNDLVINEGGVATRMYFKAGGNVGIGTTSPSTILDVNGTINVRTNGYQFGRITANNNDATNGGLTLQYINSNSFRDGIVLNYAGNVGIGTSSPASRLEVTHDGNGTTNTYSGIHIINTSSSVGSNVAARISFSGDGNSSMAGILEQRRDGGDTFWLRTLNGYSSNGTIYIQAQTNGVYLTKNATSWTSNSDERLKDIIGNIDNAIESLLALRTVKYNWKADLSKKENLGLIAQDVEKVFPQIINKNIENMLGVRYQELVPVLVKAIQELNQKAQEQQAQIEELKALINK